MECKICSAKLPEDSIFCSVCGARVDGKKICPKCEKLIEENAIFCRYCGTRLEDVCSDKVEKSAVMEQVKVEESVCADILETTETPCESTVDFENVSASNEQQTEDVGQDEKEDVPENDLTTEEDDDIEEDETQEDIGESEDYNYESGEEKIGTNYNENNSDIGYYELPKEIDEKTFYAKGLTKIALDKTSPEDIFVTGKFEEVKMEYHHYSLAKGTAEMTYSATIGYEKIEKYKSIERKYVPEGGYYTYDGVRYRADRAGTYGVDAIKERKVIDWQPYNGSYVGEYVDVNVNDNNPNAYDAVEYKDYCMQNVIKYDAKTSEAPAPLAPSATSIVGLKEGIKTMAEMHCRNNLPGDKNKNFSCSGVVSLSRLEGHVAPHYTLKYKYLGKDYALRAHACKNSRFLGDIPSAKSEIESEIEQEKSVKTCNIITLFALMFSILSAILFPIALKIVFAVIGVISFITYWVIRSKASKEIYQAKERRKKKDLINLLNKKGIAIPNNLKEGVQL